jgi:hypothetical protein
MALNDEYRATLRTAGAAREHFINAMNVAKCLLDNGEQVLLTVSVAVEPVGVQQRKFLHGPVLTQISEQVRINGERFTTDVWKEHLKNVILEREPEYVMRKLPGAKRATPRRVRRSTESLGVRDYAKFIDEVIDYAVAEWGVQFRFEMNEREAVRYVDPRRLKKSQPAIEATTATT